MILIVTNRDDLTADWLILELQRRSTPYLRFNTEDYPDEINLTWRPDGQILLVIRGERYDMRRFHSVWYRRPLIARSADTDDPLATSASGESQEALSAVWRTHDAIWVNRPDSNRSASCKPDQLVAAHQLGLDVPETLINNDRESVLAFADGTDGLVWLLHVLSG